MLMLIALAFTAQPRCDLVDSIDEGIATCVQNDGSYFQTLAQKNMYEGANDIPIDVYEFITFTEDEVEPIVF